MTMTKTTDTRKTMTTKQIAYYTGKRVDPVKWVIPHEYRGADYALCEMTGKMYPAEAFTRSFDNQAFTYEELKAAGIAHIEDASFLSDEGFDLVLAALKIQDYNDYIERVFCEGKYAN